MGFASIGGCLKLDLRDSIGDWARMPDTAIPRQVAVRRMACGNLEDKRGMTVDYSGGLSGAVSATGASRMGVERPATVGWSEVGWRSKTMISFSPARSHGPGT